MWLKLIADFHSYPYANLAPFLQFITRAPCWIGLVSLISFQWCNNILTLWFPRIYGCPISSKKHHERTLSPHGMCPVCLQQQRPLQQIVLVFSIVEKKQLFNSPHALSGPATHTFLAQQCSEMENHFAPSSPSWTPSHAILCAVESSLLSSSPSEFRTRTTISLFGAYLHLRRIPTFRLALFQHVRVGVTSADTRKKQLRELLEPSELLPRGLFSKARKQSHHFSSVLSRVWVLCGSVGHGKNWTKIRHILRWNAGKTVKCDCWFCSTTILSDGCELINELRSKWFINTA